MTGRVQKAHDKARSVAVSRPDGCQNPAGEHGRSGVGVAINLLPVIRVTSVHSSIRTHAHVFSLNLRLTRGKHVLFIGGER